MTNQEANMILSLYLMQCGMMMPIEWVQKNGENSEFMQAYKMAMDALKNEPVRCKDCKFWDKETGFCDKHSRFYHGGMDWDMFSDEDFCSQGERKTK